MRLRTKQTILKLVMSFFYSQLMNLIQAKFCNKSMVTYFLIKYKKNNCFKKQYLKIAIIL